MYELVQQVIESSSIPGLVMEQQTTPTQHIFQLKLKGKVVSTLTANWFDANIEKEALNMTAAFVNGWQYGYKYGIRKGGPG